MKVGEYVLTRERKFFFLNYSVKYQAKKYHAREGVSSMCCSGQLVCVVEAKTTQAVFGEYTSQNLRVGPLYVTHIAIDKKVLQKIQPDLRNTNNNCLPMTNNCCGLLSGSLMPLC